MLCEVTKSSRAHHNPGRPIARHETPTKDERKRFLLSGPEDASSGETNQSSEIAVLLVRVESKEDLTIPLPSAVKSLGKEVSKVWFSAGANFLPSESTGRTPLLRRSDLAFPLMIVLCN